MLLKRKIEMEAKKKLYVETTMTYIHIVSEINRVNHPFRVLNLCKK